MTTRQIKQPAAGRKPLLEQHPIAAGMFPPMEGEEFDALVADIEANGLHEAVTVYEGKILDGFNRARACRVLGFEPNYLPVDYYFDDEPVDDATARAYVISVNAHRRHLTPEQKRQAIEALIKASPEKSDRTIAKTAKVDHKTVAAVRADKEATGEIPQLAKRTGSDGKERKQPAAKSTADKPRHLKQPTAAQKQAEIDIAQSTTVFDNLPKRGDVEKAVAEVKREHAHTIERMELAHAAEIKDLVDARRPKLAASDPKGTLYCSFCNKSQHQVRDLITGGPKNKVCICNECTALCADIVREREAKAAALPETQGAAAKTDPVTTAAPSMGDDPFEILPFLDRTTRH